MIASVGKRAKRKRTKSKLNRKERSRQAQIKVVLVALVPKRMIQQLRMRIQENGRGTIANGVSMKKVGITVAFIIRPIDIMIEEIFLLRLDITIYLIMFYK